MPVLGICRGSQIIAVAEGGTLYQDLSLAETSLKHSRAQSGDAKPPYPCRGRK
ncbi:gamma-glutamyl-gamma-aminobutyrate hydrolase family protein [Suipraeoptans intestinalis]|uniref:gamma-glutamyl-gamma-aminobutyrate hydrolase family protein n=1 Tax=Suipraeoptans intestinalis TaxID=2606628 RepID=UPI001F1C3C72|nr:gamma-glutamyl-gamma-aminobutyrate hydrolase family protein [Suipraeoptans intestinalis]